uniref:ATPbinding Cassette (ABC) superfamily putative n=1 Tax=Albugo laibachii Nc14 TaxID=890382 RepID=F0W264_9STRA|nr:ATPbinding Cassette (ABC) superfamily putative [Albugo laibachii Nc14]|eukprot:CCA15146.1 ATPbinding Cassette (ABC) superfamily putative [Albugo laibachii Nc14]
MCDQDTVAKEIVNVLRQTGARLVCIDFDSTFLTIHTGGEWEKPASELQKYIRKLFVHLIPCIRDAQIHVAVVTFSPQVALIKELLELCFGSALAQSIIVRGDDSSCLLTSLGAQAFDPFHPDKALYFDRRCKLRYIASAATEASMTCCQPIQTRHTVLIDDDPANVRIAKDTGVAGIYFEVNDTTLTNLCERIKQLHVASPTITYATPLKTRTRTMSRSFSTPDIGAKERRFPYSKKNILYTPSPALKIKYTVDMGRPKSKRAARAATLPRKIYS